ncbi:MAG: hypothetical protein VB050_06635 [Geobacteraceae bacterium]|nr:hypothetical protein [Geobacteraceae bacterium]
MKWGETMTKLFFTILVVVLLLGGCASRQELTGEILKVRKTGNGGVTRVYPVDTNQAWEITMAVFRWENTDEIEEHRDENYVITSTGMKMAAYGSVMGVWIEQADANASRITIISKRRVKRDKFTRLDAETFYQRFEQGLKILKEGKKLPIVLLLDNIGG